MPTFFLQPIEAQPDGGFQPATIDLGHRFRYVGRDAPNTTGWLPNEFWYDTAEEGSTGAVVRRWTGTEFIPDPTGSGATYLLDDPFTGANDSAWSASWTTGRDPSVGTGGGATIQGNMGRLQTSNAGGYAGGNRVSRRADIAAPVDVNITYSFKFDSTECFSRVYARADNALNSEDGYFMDIGKGTYRIGYSEDFGGDWLDTQKTFNHTVGAVYAARFYVVDDDIKAKVWLLSDTEPTDWGTEATDTTFTAAGAVGFSVGGGAAASSSNWFVDDVVIRDA